MRKRINLLKIKTRSRLNRFRAKWPLVAQDAHRNAIEAERRRLEHEASRLKAETTEVKASIDRVLPKLANLSMDRPDPNRYRLIVDIDPIMIRHAFEWGNDRRVIEYFGERIGHQVTRELLTMNMHRFEEVERMPRPYYGPREVVARW